MNAAVIIVSCSSVQVSVPYRMFRIVNVLCSVVWFAYGKFEGCSTRPIISIISKNVVNFFVTSFSLSYDMVQSK